MKMSQKMKEYNLEELKARMMSHILMAPDIDVLYVAATTHNYLLKLLVSKLAIEVGEEKIAQWEREELGEDIINNILNKKI